MAVTRTIRLENDHDSALRALAREERVSVNFLINRSLRKLIEWDVPADKFGIVSLQRGILAKMMKRLTDRDAAELGKELATNQAKSVIQFRLKETSVDSVIEMFSLGSHYSKLYEFVHTTDRNKHVLILQHSMGPRWSLFWEAMVRSVFKDVLSIELKTERTDDSCLAWFEYP